MKKKLKANIVYFQKVICLKMKSKQHKDQQNNRFFSSKTMNQITAKVKEKEKKPKIQVNIIGDEKENN